MTDIVERLRHSANIAREVSASMIDCRGEGWEAESKLYAERARLEFEAASLIESLRAERDEARAKAIEECAVIAETMRNSPIYYVDGRPNAQPIIGGQHIAEAIRALTREKTEQ